MKKLFPLLMILCLLSGCAPLAFSRPSPFPSREMQPRPKPPIQWPDEEAAPLPPDPRAETIARLLADMTVEEKVGQLFFARCPKKDGTELAEQYHLGGYLLFARDFRGKTAQAVQETLLSYQQTAAIPMLIGVDEEGGTVVRVSGNPAIRPEKFPSPRQLYDQGGLEAVRSDAREKDRLLRSLGINVNFAPVADLSTDPKNYIYPRTLGLGAEETAAYVAAVVGQMEKDGMGSVLKHFPGYGPNVDTHSGGALDARPLDKFFSADFLPFQAGLQAAQGGTAAVLVSHNVMASVDPVNPASLSPSVHRLLREELGFTGVVLTDDLAMEAAASFQGAYPAPVLALLAGNDMVVTTDFQGQIPQVIQALKDGALSQEFLDQAVSRVLGWKYDLGLLEGF